MTRCENAPPLRVVGLTVKAACKAVKAWHAHHKPPRGGMFACGVTADGVLVGVAIAGRPGSRHLQAQGYLEVTRVAVHREDELGHPNAASCLYGAIRRAAGALGWRLVSYTLPGESGASLRGAGFRCVGAAGGGTWTPNLAVPSRGLPPLLARARGEAVGAADYPTDQKIRWEWP